jgi:hypothetical protein
MTTKKKHPTTPLTPPRCDWKRCMNDAQMFPIIVVPAPKWATNKKAKIEMEMALNVCPKHAVEDINLFMDDAGFEQLVHGLGVRKLPRPNRKSIYVIFRALEDRQVA